MSELLYEWGQITDKGKVYNLHEGQRAVVNSNARFTAGIAGTGGGKTAVGPLWLAKQIQKHWELGDQAIYMVVAPTYKVLSRATVPTLIEMFRGTPLEGVYKESKSVYILPNGSKIWCQGADNPDGLEGGQFQAIWGDEAGQFKMQTWIALQGRTGLNRAPILFTTTPYGKNWLFSDFYEHFRKGDPDYYCRQWSSFTNPAYPKEEYERAKRTMTPEKFKMRYDGEFMKLEGLVYPNLHDCREEFNIEEKLREPGRLFGGIDFGWNDPFSAHSGILDKNDVLWIWYERYKSECFLERHAEALPKFYNKSIRWFADRSRPEDIIKLKKGGHHVKPAPIKKIETGIDLVSARINTGRLKIHPCCRCLLAEGEVYAYKEDDGQFIGDKPLDRDNHSMDDLRYHICGIDRKRAA